MKSGSRKRADRASVSESEARRAFRALLTRTRREVDRKLESRFARELKQLGRVAPGALPLLEAARDLSLRGGKRFRAALLKAAYHGVAPKAAHAPADLGAASIELLQTYFLIQDDWMDGDRERRGGPSVHVALTERLGSSALGASSAILASDYVFGMAQQALLEAAVPPARKAAAAGVLLAAHQEVVIGQALDVANRPDTDHALVHELKTGSYTTKAPLLLGATLAGARPEALRALERFARPLGLAFQLRDDLLGVFGSAELAGRAASSDLRTGKRTSVIAAAFDRADARQTKAIERVFGRPKASAAQLAAARKAIEASGALAAISSKLWALCDRAEALALALPLHPAGRLTLAGAASSLRPGPFEKSVRGTRPHGKAI